MEWLLENELESVTRRLNESERNNNNDDANNNSSNEQQSDLNVKEVEEEDTNNVVAAVNSISKRWMKLLDSLNDNTAAVTKDTTPYERIHKQYTHEYQHYKCHEYPIHTLLTSNVGVEDIWTELYHYYIKFALGGKEEEGGKKKEVDIIHYYLKKRRLSCNPDLYINFTTPSLDENNGTNSSLDRGGSILSQTQRLYSSKNFSKDEVVYSHKHSTYYFSSISQWRTFLHSLPATKKKKNKLQCAAIQFTIFKRISRPGRWLVGLVLDEGIFIRKRKGDDRGKNEQKGNVALYDERTLDYIATRYIREGEVIVDDGPTVEE